MKTVLKSLVFLVTAAIFVTTVASLVSFAKSVGVPKGYCGQVGAYVTGTSAVFGKPVKGFWLGMTVDEFLSTYNERWKGTWDKGLYFDCGTLFSTDKKRFKEVQTFLRTAYPEVGWMVIDNAQIRFEPMLAFYDVAKKEWEIAKGSCLEAKFSEQGILISLTFKNLDLCFNKGDFSDTEFLANLLRHLGISGDGIYESSGTLWLREFVVRKTGVAYSITPLGFRMRIASKTSDLYL